MYDIRIKQIQEDHIIEIMYQTSTSMRVFITKVLIKCNHKLNETYHLLSNNAKIKGFCLVYQKSVNFLNLLKFDIVINSLV